MRMYAVCSVFFSLAWHVATLVSRSCWALSTEYFHVFAIRLLNPSFCANQGALTALDAIEALELWLPFYRRWDSGCSYLDLDFDLNSLMPGRDVVSTLIFVRVFFYFPKRNTVPRHPSHPSSVLPNWCMPFGPHACFSRRFGVAQSRSAPRVISKDFRDGPGIVIGHSQSVTLRQGSGEMIVLWRHGMVYFYIYGSITAPGVQMGSLPFPNETLRDRIRFSCIFVYKARPIFQFRHRLLANKRAFSPRARLHLLSTMSHDTAFWFQSH